MKKKPTEYEQILLILKELKENYPSYSMGRHLSTALGDYGDVWGITNKEMLFAFTKYKATLEMDVPHETGVEELEQIIKDGMNLKPYSTFVDEE